jgi:hypothetical protein
MTGGANGRRRLIRAGNLGFVPGTTALSVDRVKNLLTGRNLLEGGEQSFIVRLPSRVSDPVFVTRVVSQEWSPLGGKIVALDESGRYRVTLRVTPATDGLRFEADVVAPEPIWMVEWTLKGLDLKRMIVPALGGQALDRRMPVGTQLSYKYPFWWNAQFLIGEAEGGGIWFRTKDADPRFKVARVRRSSKGFDLTYGFEADGPLVSKGLRAEWYLDCYRGSWKVPVGIHRTWMESAFGAVPLGSRSGGPSWMRDVNFVLEMWGIGKESAKPLHTFREMEARLRAFARLHPPEHTLVYLPGYAEHGIDSRAPHYNPSKELGGDAGFRSLVNAAHRLGYRVMIHTNVLCMTFDHPLYPKFKKHQVVDVFGKEQGWGLDIDGDWLAEPYFAYINPGAKPWGDLMTAVIGDLVRRFNVDGVFLDQTLLAFNVARGPNFVTGMRSHVRRLVGEFPEVLFAGEGLHEQILEPLAMAQIHGIDSIAEVHALDGAARWRTAHPVSTELFGRYTRYTAHLLTRHPSHPMFRHQEAAYAKLNVIPALCLYNKSQKLLSPPVRAMLRRARRMK